MKLPDFKKLTGPAITFAVIAAFGFGLYWLYQYWQNQSATTSAEDEQQAAVNSYLSALYSNAENSEGLQIFESGMEGVPSTTTTTPAATSAVNSTPATVTLASVAPLPT